jgi:hypothetical protein
VFNAIEEAFNEVSLAVQGLFEAMTTDPIRAGEEACHIFFWTL